MKRVQHGFFCNFYFSKHWKNCVTFLVTSTLTVECIKVCKSIISYKGNSIIKENLNFIIIVTTFPSVNIRLFAKKKMYAE